MLAAVVAAVDMQTVEPQHQGVLAIRHLQTRHKETTGVSDMKYPSTLAAAVAEHLKPETQTAEVAEAMEHRHLLPGQLYSAPVAVLERLVVLAATVAAAMLQMAMVRSTPEAVVVAVRGAAMLEVEGLES